MNILITGAAGQLGQELQRQLTNEKSVLGPLPAALRGANVVAVDLPDADLSDLAQSKALLQKHRPDVVFNCAAFTAVDSAETERDAAFAANALIPRNLAIACEELGAALVHVSTDYVFDGAGDEPLPETALPGPATVYGATKLLGEEYVKSFCRRWFIVRTAWLYGRVGGNFVKTMLKLADERDELTVVNDQRGNPTNAEDLAHHLLALSVGEQYGLYHITGGGICSWYDFACEIMRLAGKTVKMTPCTTEEYPRPAKRPANSALEHTMLRATIGDKMRPWQEALASYVKEISSGV